MIDEWDPDANKIRNLHSVETPISCKRIGGSWEKGVCIGEEWGTVGLEIGVTAPVKGAYFWYEINDFDDDGYPSGKYHGNVSGCLVKDSEDYPYAPGWCYAFYEKYFPPQKWVGDKARDHMIDVARDVLKGRAEKHGLGYFTRDGKKLAGPAVHSFVGDSDGDIFKEMDKYVKSFSFKRGGKHA